MEVLYDMPRVTTSPEIDIQSGYHVPERINLSHKLAPGKVMWVLMGGGILTENEKIKQIRLGI